MPRYTLFYDGTKTAEATAADAAKMESVPGLRILNQQPGLLLIMASEQVMREVIPTLDGWIANKEQHAVHPKPKRPSVKRKESKNDQRSSAGTAEVGVSNETE